MGANSSESLSFPPAVRCYIRPADARRTDQGVVSMSFAGKLEILIVYAAFAFVGAIILGMF